MSSNYTETELQLILNKITSEQASTITMNEGELHLAPDTAVYSVNNVTPTNGNVSIPEGANKDLSNLSTTGNAKFQAPITGGASTITSSNLTANKALVSNSSGKVAVSSVTLSELGYVSGVTSNIQTQLNNKLAKKPDGTNDLVDSNNKVNITYLPDVVLGQMLYAGTFVPSTAVATLSTNAKTILGTTSNTITLTNDTSAITGYEANEGNYYIASSDGTFASISFLTGDWLISTGSGWTKVSNTDAVTGVKGNAESTYRTGNVNITPSDIGAYPDTNPSDYTSNIGTVTSVNNTSPDGNGNVSLTIPTVNNPTITITQGGTTKGSFTLNQSSGDTIALDAGGGTATDVQINGRSITSNNVANILTEGQYGSLNKIATMAVVPTAAYEVGAVATAACAEVYPVIQKYQSGTSWYRIYSDGWCEMGGQTTQKDETVTFLKTFENVNYSIIGNELFTTTQNEYELNIIKISVTQARIYCSGSSWGGVGACWRASGKLAEGQY